MPEADRCSLNIPFPSWARDNPDSPDLDYQNWLEVMRWADRYHREKCGGGGGTMTIDLGEAAPFTGYTRIFHIREAGDLTVVVGRLDIAGTTDTVAEVVMDGSSDPTPLTIPANETYGTWTGAMSAGNNSGWQMRITQVGAGAQGLAYYGEAG